MRTTGLRLKKAALECALLGFVATTMVSATLLTRQPTQSYTVDHPMFSAEESRE